MDLRHLALPRERVWADEVLHLHSLWYQGVPHPPGPTPILAPVPTPNPHLRPARAAAFKNDSRKKSYKKKTKKKAPCDEAKAYDPPRDTGKEWPCDPLIEPRPSTDSWGDGTVQWPPANLQPLPAAAARAGAAARAAADGAQYGGLKACEGLLSKSHGSDDEGTDEEDEMDVDSMNPSSTLDFFLGIFEKDGVLREYYQKNCERGAFSCLVCEAVGVKKGKRFGDCIALVQHSNQISRTKKKRAHRAFAKAICRVLGWDMERLPSIVLDSKDRLCQSSAKPSNLEESTPRKDLLIQEEVSQNKEGCSIEVANGIGRNDGDMIDIGGIQDAEVLTSEHLQEIGCKMLVDCTDAGKRTESWNTGLPREEETNNKEGLGNKSDVAVLEGLMHDSSECAMKKDATDTKKELVNDSDKAVDAATVGLLHHLSECAKQKGDVTDEKEKLAKASDENEDANNEDV